MEKSVVNAGYDIKKMPLGELSKETVLKGYKILRDIENVITNKNTGDLADLSS
jgi:poly [ADP-ribose] polymerase